MLDAEEAKIVVALDLLFAIGEREKEERYTPSVLL